MGDQLSVRVAESFTARERSQLANILIAVVAQGASVGFLPPLEREAALVYWDSLPRPDAIVLLAEQHGQVVGTAQLHLAGQPNGRHRAEVAKVLVHPDHQRQGIGRALMTRLEDVARLESRTLLVLDTREGDPSNQLYRGCGYIEAGRIPRYARAANGELRGTVIYYKLLA